MRPVASRSSREGPSVTGAWFDRAAALLASPWALGMALVLAAVVRVAHLRSFHASPLAAVLQLDHRVYDQWARRIAGGEWIGRGVFWVDPLYAYFLAVIYKVFGHNLLLVRGIQVAMGVGVVALVADIAQRISGRRAVAHGAAFMAALYVPLIHNEVLIEKATLTTLLATGALAAFLRETPRGLLTAGILMGFAILGRGNLLLALPFAVAAVALHPPEASESSEPEPRSWSVPGGRVTEESLRRALLFLGGVMVVVGMLTARNAVVAREFLPTTAIGGPSLYAAQLESNTTGSYQPPPFVRPASDTEHDDFHAEAERRTGRRMTDVQVNSYWAREGIKEALSHPLHTLKHSIRKLLLSFHDVEVSDNDDVSVTRQYAPVLWLPVWWMGQVAALGLLGAVVSWRQSRAARVTVGAIGAYTLSLVIFYVMGRLRLPMAPSLIALAAVGAAWILERARTADMTRLGMGLGGVAIAFGVLLHQPEWLEDMVTSSRAVAWQNHAGQLLEMGRPEAAMAVYAQAIEIRPASLVGAMRTLGDMYLERRRYEDAERMMLRVLVHRPDSPLGKAALIRLYERMSEDPTVGPSAVRARLAAAYRAAGRTADADRIAIVRGGAAGTGINTTTAPTPGGGTATRITVGGTEPPAPFAGETLTATQRATIVRSLSVGPRGSPVWITATTWDPRAVTRAEELAGLFRQAGWEVRTLERSEVRVRPGHYLFVGDEEAPRYVGTVHQALTNAGLAPALSTGYRAYYDEMARTRTGFQGFRLAEGQAYWLVVGRVPEPDGGVAAP